MVEEMEEKLRKAEDDMEVEKEKLVQEVSRGKTAAISLLQVHLNSVTTKGIFSIY